MKVLILSAGLMGGSIAKALIQKGHEVHSTTIIPLKYTGINFYTGYEKIPKLEYDIICICSPRGKKYEIYDEMFQVADKNASSNTYIVDISSVQNRNNYYQLKYEKFIPCHPIAGSEKRGFENSSAEILKGKQCLVIKENPPPEVKYFWEECGMIVDNSITSCMEHDRIFAKVSHLPQLISFNFPPEEKPEYKEFYRLKYSSREIWDEIFLHNKDWILSNLGDFPITFGNGWEEMLSNGFNAITNEETKYAGTGFRTITSAKNFNTSPNIPKKDYDIVHNIIDNAWKFLINLR